MAQFTYKKKIRPGHQYGWGQKRNIGKKNYWKFVGIQDQKRWHLVVALGYSQIPGIDYSDNFAPAAHDVSFRIALARMMVEN